MRKSHPEIDIDRLRMIGWTLWDPIGLDGGSGRWKTEPFADEYDAYLLKAADMLRTGENHDVVVDYLIHVESSLMSLGPDVRDAETTMRLRRVVKAISEDRDVWSGHQG